MFHGHVRVPPLCRSIHLMKVKLTGRIALISIGRRVRVQQGILHPGRLAGRMDIDPIGPDGVGHDAVPPSAAGSHDGDGLAVPDRGLHGGLRQVGSHKLRSIVCSHICRIRGCCQIVQCYFSIIFVIRWFIILCFLIGLMGIIQCRRLRYILQGIVGSLELAPAEGIHVPPGKAVRSIADPRVGAALGAYLGARAGRQQIDDREHKHPHARRSFPIRF